MIRTFIDAGVLIAAATGRFPDVQGRARAVLDDPDRVYIASPFVELEVLPKAIHGQRSAEVAFYRAYFSSAHMPLDLASVIATGLDLASRFGLNGMGALHLAAAQSQDADEFITTERPTSPIFRLPKIRITTIRPSQPHLHP